MSTGWESGCIDYAENMHSTEPHEHTSYCQVIAEALDEDRQADIDARTVAGNTPAERHANECRVKIITDSGVMVVCNCWVITAARVHIRNNWGE